MTQITRIILAIHLLIASSMGWAQEPPQTPGPAPSEQAPPDQIPRPTQPAGTAQPEGTPPAPEEKPQAKPEVKAPDQGASQPTGTAQPEGTPPAPEEKPQAKPEVKAPDQGASQPTGTAQPEGAPPPPGGTPPAKPEEKSAETALHATEEEKKKTVSTALEQAPSIIKGRLELEVSETYSHLNSNQLFIDGFGILPVLVVGNVQIERVRTDIFNTTFTTRYKITNDLQAEVRIPYLYEMIRVSTPSGITGRTTASANVESTSSSSGLGDVNADLSYHLLNETLTRPAIYVGLGIKARTGRDIFETDDAVKNPPTGSGFNSVSVNVNAVKVADPAVVYGSLGYAYAQPRKNVVWVNPGQNRPSVLVDYSPGDSISLGFGLAYALNYKLTLSTGYQQTVNLASYINGRKLPSSNTNAISLRFGLVWRFNAQTSMDISVSPGLSLDTPAVQVGVRIPYRF
jgi:hypothetical protein